MGTFPYPFKYNFGHADGGLANLLAVITLPALAFHSVVDSLGDPRVPSVRRTRHSVRLLRASASQCACHPLSALDRVAGYAAGLLDLPTSRTAAWLMFPFARLNWIAYIGRMKKGWRQLECFLPENWRELAGSKGALKGLCEDKSAKWLLWVLVIQLGCGHLPREIAVRGRRARLAELSSVALWKRLQKSHARLRVQCIELFQEWGSELVGPASFHQRYGHGLATVVLAGAVVIALIGNHAAAQTFTESFTDSQGRTMLYKYSLEDLPNDGRLPGLLLRFHGNNCCSQLDMLSLSFGSTKSVATSHGLIPVALASPEPTEPGVARFWAAEDLLLIHEFLQSGLDNQFEFDRNRVVFWGGSQGTGFLHRFIHMYGTNYGGGLFAECGPFGFEFFEQNSFKYPRGFKNRFKVFVMAATEDFLHYSSVQAYFYYKYLIGLDTFGDLSTSGGHCRGGGVGYPDAVGWILGTHRLAAGETGEMLESPLPLQWTERPTPVSVKTECHDHAIMGARGTGGALRLKGTADGGFEIPLQNVGAPTFRIETLGGSEKALRGPAGVAVDAAGNVYVADLATNQVKRIDPAGVITTIAGTGEPGYSGDGGQATDAMLWFGESSSSSGVAVDGMGNVYVADTRNHRVRRIDSAGVITTIAGTGEPDPYFGYPYANPESGDGGLATEVALTHPRGVAADAAGNAYVIDGSNYRVRRINSAGVITTIAGTGEPGYSGDGGLATHAAVNAMGVAVDAMGNVYLADTWNHRVRRINSAGVIETIAGTGLASYSGDAGRATDAALVAPVGIAVDVAGNVYVSSPENNRVRRIGSNGVIETVAGNGLPGYSGDPGPATRASIFPSSHLAVDAVGKVYIPIEESSAIAVLSPDSTLNVSLGESGEIIKLGLTEKGVLTRHDNTLFSGAQVLARNGERYSLSQRSDGTILARKVAAQAALVGQTSNLSPAVSRIWTLAGTGLPGSIGDGGRAIQAGLHRPFGVAVDAAGNAYVAEQQRGLIRRLGPSGEFETIAGVGPWNSSYESAGVSRATERVLGVPEGVAVDAAGNVYVADVKFGSVLKIDSAGAITMIARGPSEPGSNYIPNPRGVAVDRSGNVYVADARNHVVRRIDAAGVIATIAGTGQAGFSGDGGPATEAALRNPVGVAVDRVGNVYVTDFGNHRLRIITAATYEANVQLGSSGETRTFEVSSGGTVTLGGRLVRARDTILGCNGYTYQLNRTSNGRLRATYVSERDEIPLLDGGTISLARNEAGTWRIGADIVRSGHRHVQNGFEYVLDFADGEWRLATHALRTVAGHVGVNDGIDASLANLYSPSAIAVDAGGNLYIADRDNNRIRRVDSGGTISTLAGTGERGYSGDGGPATGARLNRPSGVAVDEAGYVYVADSGNHAVRRIDLTGTIAAFAGTGARGYGGDGGPAIEAQQDSPFGVAADAVGHVYVADFGNHAVRRIDLTGAIATFAGTGARGYGGDGRPAIEAQLDSPFGVAADTIGRVYVADSGNHAVRRIDLTGTIATFAGTGARGYGGDGGPATEAQMNGPFGVAADAAGDVYVSDYLNRRVRRVGATGMIVTIAGVGEGGYSGDGGPATESHLGGPTGLAVDTLGSVYVADLTNHRIRRISSQGNISTVAGTGAPFNRGDGGLAEHGQLSLAIADVAVDRLGNVYVADPYDHTVRSIDVGESISTLVGTGEAGFGGDGGPAIEGLLDKPSGVAVDAVGNVYVADTRNHRIRRVDTAGMIQTLAGIGRSGFSGEFALASLSRLSYPEKVEVDDAGNIYVLDSGNERVRVIYPSGRIRTIAGNGKWEDLLLTRPHVIDQLVQEFIGRRATGVSLLGASDLGVGPNSAGGNDLYLAVTAPLGIGRLWTVALGNGPIVERFLSTSGGLQSLAVGADEAVYIVDEKAIRLIGQDGSASTVAELDEYGISVGGMAIDEFKRIWFSDPENRRVRVLAPVH